MTLTRLPLLALFALSGCGEAVVGDSPEGILGNWSLTSITVLDEQETGTITITNQNGSATVDGMAVRVEGAWTFVDDGTFDREYVFFFDGVPGNHPDANGSGTWTFADDMMVLDEPAGTITQETHMILDADLGADTLSLVQTDEALAADSSLPRAMTFAR